MAGGLPTTLQVVANEGAVMSAAQDNTENSKPGEFEAQLGEPLEQVLDRQTWRQGDQLDQTYARLEAEVREGLDQEARISAEIVRRVLPLISHRTNAPKGAGRFKASLNEVKWLHSHLLFNGATVAADGTVVAHETMLLTIAQIGVCIVNYSGATNEFHKQLFRRDVRLNSGDVVGEMVALLEARQRRASLGYEDPRDELNQLMRRGVMAYAERGFLLDNAQGKWIMGHGSPVPRELLAVSSQTVLTNSLDVLRELVLGHQKFVYVPSEPREMLIRTLGNSLQPLEFLIVDTLYDQMDSWVQEGNYSREMGRRIRQFIEEVGRQIIRGVYRASAHSPACVFYAHIDHAQEAALLALADSVLQEHRGFPMLLELADTLCRVSFEPASFRNVVQQSYARAGQPFRYLSERETRR